MTLASDGTLGGTFDKTWQQIRDAMQSKICVVVATNGDNAKNVFIQEAVDNPEPMDEDGRYQVYTVNGTSPFTTDSKDGYPAIGGIG